MEWDYTLYVDAYLSFGLRSAPKQFNILADPLSWMLKHNQVTPVLHYLDDFLTQDHLPALTTYSPLEWCALELGVPLAMEKVEMPSDCLTFLGIIFDTNKMEVDCQFSEYATYQPSYTKLVVKRALSSWLITVRHKSSVAWQKLCIKNVWQGSQTQTSVILDLPFVRIFHSNLRWFHLFIYHWNGMSFYESFSYPDAQIQTDVSGNLGMWCSI